MEHLTRSMISLKEMKQVANVAYSLVIALQTFREGVLDCVYILTLGLCKSDCSLSINLRWNKCLCH